MLAGLARKRRWWWPSRAAAHDSLVSKPPFSLWHPQAMCAFVAHGTRPSSSPGPTAGPAAAPPQPGGRAPEGGPVELRCLPATEERVYGAFEPPPVARRVQCPVRWCVSGTTSGVHSRLGQLGLYAAQDLPCVEVHRCDEPWGPLLLLGCCAGGPWSRVHAA